jgi:HAD superfamily hydrolase (TIGR01484 family)
MRYLTLATDYDGTLALHGRVDDQTLAGLDRLKQSGRKLVMVTGRELDELMEVFPHLEKFDRVVAENGALVYDPATKRETVLGERANLELVERLQGLGVDRISAGRVIVALWEPHQKEALEVIREMGLELQVIFNKGAVMVLPSGINKASGLAVALEELGLSPHNTVAVGDAENDHAFLSVCECSAAVENALPSLKERADIVLELDHGAGVVELIDRMLADDLKSIDGRLARHAIAIGPRVDQIDDEEAPPVSLPLERSNVMIAGTSGGGKTTLTTGLLERIADAGYQYLVIDPEGDYSEMETATVVGDPKRAPLVDEVMALLEQPKTNVVVNLLGVPLEHRPAFFSSLLPRVQDLRARTGRPHWAVVDEAHHLLPTTWDPAVMTLPKEPSGAILITVHPEAVAKPVMESVETLLVIGKSPAETVKNFYGVVGEKPPIVPASPLKTGDVLVVSRRASTSEPPVLVRSIVPRVERSRHSRKYAEGHVGPERAFVFTGPEGKLSLKAQNLVVFLQMADGVDDETWAYHLAEGDVSKWFREVIKDDDLGREAEAIEAGDHPAAESRAAIREIVERRYTLPADVASGGIIEAASASTGG